MILLKTAFEIFDDLEPFRVKVAVPNQLDSFSVYEFRFNKLTNATQLLMAYLYEFDKRPESIFEFHLAQVEKVSSNRELPFMKR